MCISISSSCAASRARGLVLAGGFALPLVHSGLPISSLSACADGGLPPALPLALVHIRDEWQAAPQVAASARQPSRRGHAVHGEPSARRPIDGESRAISVCHKNGNAFFC